LAHLCAALRAKIQYLSDPVADATGNKYAGLRPEVGQPEEHLSVKVFPA